MEKIQTKHPKSTRLKKRRGITDIIGTMMLMAITVTGAATLTYFVNDVFVSGNLSTATTLDSSPPSLTLLAYDTRDSSSLLTLSNLDNNFDGKLCGSSCIATNDLPINNGSEFIIMKIKNNSFNSVFLDDVKINNVEHDWDAYTSGMLLDTTTPDFTNSDGRNYPLDGKFSILEDNSNPTQLLSREIPSGKTVNLLIKLGSEDPDLFLSKGVRVLLNVGSMTPVEFLLESGDVR